MSSDPTMGLGSTVGCVLIGAVASVALNGGARAQTWTEVSDAPSFPDGTAQVTRGDTLATITGATSGSDLRDAYCVRIVATELFSATTDSSEAPTASASFDTRLFLFDQWGTPVLANDEAVGAVGPSTLTATATDGSNQELEKNADYVLVVTGASAVPQDGAGTPVDQFDIDSDLDAVHWRASSSGRFEAWDGGAAQFGSYTVALAGAVPCLEEPGLAFSRSGEPSRLCRGNGVGGLSFCEAGPDGASASAAVALGNIGGDATQDGAFANVAEFSQTCSGTSNGLVFCVDIAGSSVNATDVALARVDDDDDPDLLVANDDNTILCIGDGGGLFSCSQVADDPTFADSTGVAADYFDDDARLDFVLSTDGEDNRVCLSNVVGGGFAFPSCTSVSANNDSSQAVAAGRFDGDGSPDAVFANSGAPNRICLGSGSGAFSCQNVEVLSYDARDLAVGDLDGDGNLDVVFAAGSGDENRACLGAGDGSFACADVDAATDEFAAVALTHLDNDGVLDAVFAGAAERLCLGDGVGGFSCLEVDAGGATNTTDVAVGRRVESSLFVDGFESGSTSSWS